MSRKSVPSAQGNNTSRNSRRSAAQGGYFASSQSPNGILDMVNGNGVFGHSSPRALSTNQTVKKEEIYAILKSALDLVSEDDFEGLS